MASRHECLSKTSLSKSLKILILLSRVLTANLIASANLGFTLVFKALIQIQTIDKALVCLPVSWQTTDASEVLNMLFIF